VAIYHLSAQIIGRGDGRSSTAAAAYRLGTVMDDERTGQRYDYSRKTGVDGWQIIGPDNMPDHFHDPARLWNTVEAVEKRQDAQLCREINIALPCELTAEQNRALVIDWCQDFASAGMIACVAFHHLREENPHAHVMLTLREVSSGGFGHKVRAWNDRKALDHWRETWAEMVNHHLAAKGLETRVDHRTLETQGVERAPTQHQGPIAHAIAKRGAVPDRSRVVMPTPPTMGHEQAAEDVARERNEPAPEPLPPHVREALEQVAHARQAHQTAVIEEAQRHAAAQRAAAERFAKKLTAQADWQAHQAAAQCAKALRRETQEHGANIEQWKRRRRWRVWLWRHGIDAAIPDAVRQADKARAEVKQRAAEAERHRQSIAELAAVSQRQFVQADNAHQHRQRVHLNASRQVAEAVERMRRADARWADAIKSGGEQRKAERLRQQAGAIDQESIPMQRRHLRR